MLYVHECLKESHPITHALLDELMDVRLIDNTVDDAARAWGEINDTVVKFITPLERETSFLRDRVKLLEQEIDEAYSHLGEKTNGVNK
jgi:hypothetical protein